MILNTSIITRWFNNNPLNKWIKNKENKFQLNFLFKCILRYKRELLWVFFISAVGNILLLAPMIFMLQIFDRVFISKSMFTLVTVTSIIVYFYIVTAVCDWLRSKIVIALGLRIDRELAPKIFSESFKKQLNDPDEDPGIFLNDLTQIRQWLTGPAFFAFFDAPWIPFYVFVMFVLHPVLGYLSIVFIFLLIGLALYSIKATGSLTEICNDEERSLNAFMYSKLRNTEIINVYGMANNFRKIWNSSRLKTMKLLSFSSNKGEAIQQLGKQFKLLMNSLSLGAAALLVMYGELSLGAMIAAAMLMARTTAPVDSLTASYSTWHLAKSSIKRLESLISIDDFEKIHISEPCKELKLENINIKSELKATPVLNNVSLIFKAGQITAITGASGSGKSMLIKTILGINSNYEGNILFNDYHSQELSDKFFSTQVGYLAQEVTMFQGSIAENIARMGIPNSEEVVLAARHIGIHYFVLKLPRGYDTVIQGGTESLSGGERQRIGVARAIYAQPSVILLDEPNSSLDAKGELGLVNAMRQMKKLNSLVIVVTHRKSIIPACDRVITLDDGNIVSDINIETWKLENKIVIK